ncbi:MAG: hypothetical protein J4F36_12285 [Nitrosopumilaceae archaeon]|nr:hypothetical protein [Nitrosopumilaceae archaeon]
MVKRFKKHPYSFSFSEKLIEKLRYYKNTHPDNRLSQEVETYLDALIPNYR